eukprot:Unigene16875_Nuclearia_a/m.49730 Unigene16875_Nuclearia_a/g.49730  ORF Unigene16875_Nuclearia_a/g.49730 Unigene16875_Nuclearia_a/m.49730 type:complete len:202 (+) Unigene16875_Nuclearia_a:610-1215(+)
MMLGLSKEMGMDGFRSATISRGGSGAEATPAVFDIDLLQIKLGAVGRAHITAGGEYTGKSADNSGQARAMVGSACAGFNKLLKALEGSLLATASSSAASSDSSAASSRATRSPSGSSGSTHENVSPANYNINSITFWLVTNKKLNADARALFTDPASEAIAYVKAHCKAPLDAVHLKIIAGEDFLGVVPQDARDVIGVSRF